MFQSPAAVMYAAGVLLHFEFASAARESTNRAYHQVSCAFLLCFPVGGVVRAVGGLKPVGAPVLGQSGGAWWLAWPVPGCVHLWGSSRARRVFFAAALHSCVGRARVLPRVPGVPRHDDGPGPWLRKLNPNPFVGTCVFISLWWARLCSSVWCWACATSSCSWVGVPGLAACGLRFGVRGLDSCGRQC
jgi:hypothetical protein